jgi:hypothetical protein
MYSRLIMSMHVELSPIDTVVQHALPPAREQGFPFFRTQAELVGNAICDIRDALLVWFQFGPKALDLIEHGREPSFNGGKGAAVVIRRAPFGRSLLQLFQDFNSFPFFRNSYAEPSRSENWKSSLRSR